MSYTGTGNGSDYQAPVRVIGTTALDEKRDMIGLNDRLAAFLNRLRQMQNNAGQMDTTAYHQAIQNLKDEVDKLRKFYEDQLERLRQQLARANADNSKLASENNRKEMIIQDQDASIKRLTAENEKLKRMLDDMSNQLTQKEREIGEHRGCIQRLEARLNNLQPENGDLRRMIEDLKRKLEEESRRRADVENCMKDLHSKLSTIQPAYDQLKADSDKRVKGLEQIIRILENKIRELSNQPGHNMEEMLDKLRRANAAELQRLQKDTEDALNRSMAAMKRQNDDLARDKADLQSQKKQLDDYNSKLHAELQRLNGELEAAKQTANGLGRDLANTRSDYDGKLSDRDKRLQYLQDELMKKTKEADEARQKQVSLQAEIRAYDNILQAGEVNMGDNKYPTSRTSPPGGINSQIYRSSTVQPLQSTINDTTRSKMDYMTAPTHQTAPTSTKDYCAVHGYNKGGTTSGPGLHSKGITETMDRYSDNRATTLHANPCGAPGFTSKPTTTTRYSYNTKY